MGDHCGPNFRCAARLQSLFSNFPRHKFQRISDPLNDQIDLTDDLIIPKPQHLVSRIAEKLTSTFVTIRLIRMLRTINFNDQLRLEANEICNKGPDGILPSELKSLHLVPAQSRP